MSQALFNPQNVSFPDLIQFISQLKHSSSDDEQQQQQRHLIYESCIVFLSRRLKAKKKDDVAKAKQLLHAVGLIRCNGNDATPPSTVLFTDPREVMKLSKLALKNFGIVVVVQQSQQQQQQEQMSDERCTTVTEANAKKKKMAKRNDDEKDSADNDDDKDEEEESGESDEDEDDDEDEEDQDFKDLRQSSKSESSSSSAQHTTMAQRADKYVLYQQSVQAAKQDVYLFEKIYKEHFSHQQATVFREDFCGTAWLCTEWIKRNKVENIAVGIDIDQEPIQWGLKNNISTLGSSADSVFIYTEDVLKFNWDQSLRQASVNHRQLLLDSENEDAEVECDDEDENGGQRVKKAHIVCAYNYSTCLLHERSHLIQYFTNVRKSMSPDNSIFLLDIPGGAKLSNAQERTKKTPNSQVIYMFEQESYNPCTDIVKFNINFKFTTDQSIMRKAFTFAFRKWGIREAVECLKEVGFSRVDIYWCTHAANDLEFRRLSPTEQRKLQQSDQWTALLCAIY